MIYFEELKRFFIHLSENRKLIKTLIINDFKKQYLGSYLGLFWAFAQPIMFILVIWFVFEIGFRASPSSENVPFSLWLICGMVPWFFFSNALLNGSNAVVSNSFLVKKVSFRISILPIVQIGSSFIIHVALLSLLVIIFVIYGYMPSLYWLQIFYYIFCTIFLLLGLSWLTSSIRVFVKDIGNFIAVLIQIGFWATPIFWSANQLPDKFLYIVKLNPVFYIVEGYRDTFINHIWFWEKGFDSLYFITLSSVVFVVGAMVFRKLRPHFGDVL